MEAALDKWEEQGKVLKKDFGGIFFTSCSCGDYYGHDAGVDPRIRVLQVWESRLSTTPSSRRSARWSPTKKPWQDGQHPWMSTRCPSIPPRLKRRTLTMIREIDVVNMSMQCHGYGG